MNPISKQQFQENLKVAAINMSLDKGLQNDSLDLLTKAIPHKFIQQTNWFGEPILQLPQDLFALQEIIFKTRPDFIIEVGVAWAGSLLFYSTLMAAIGGEKIIGIDTYIPSDLRSRIEHFEELNSRITLIEGSSIEQETIEKINEITKGSKKVLIHLDSDHTHAHVFKELNLYSKLIGKGYYLICGDTHVEVIPEGTHGDKPYKVGNNPMTALREFLTLPEGQKFEIDQQFQNKYLFSLNIDGYLLKTSD